MYAVTLYIGAGAKSYSCPNIPFGGGEYYVSVSQFSCERAADSMQKRNFILTNLHENDYSIA